MSSLVCSARASSRHQDLAGLGEHALLAGGEAAVLVAAPQVADDLGHLDHVAGGELLEVGLVAARPVGRLLGVRGAQDLEHTVQTFLADDVADADEVGVLGRYLDREVPLGHLQYQVQLSSPLMVRVLISSMSAAP